MRLIIRMFFILVEQVAWVLARTQVMESFRLLLKRGSTSTFLWMQKLQTAF